MKKKRNFHDKVVESKQKFAEEKRLESNTDIGEVSDGNRQQDKVQESDLKVRLWMSFSWFSSLWLIAAIVFAFATP